MEVAMSSNNNSRVYTLELDEDNYMLMRKVMYSYVETTNSNRKKKRGENTKPQKRTMQDLSFNYKII